jgi:hypothetical protein
LNQISKKILSEKSLIGFIDENLGGEVFSGEKKTPVTNGTGVGNFVARRGIEPLLPG